MESRELYKQKYEAQIQEWKAKLDVMKAQAEKLSAQAKLDIKPRIDAAHAKFEAAKARLDEIAKATDEKWGDVVKDVDKTWADLKAAAEGAYDAVKRRSKD